MPKALFSETFDYQPPKELIAQEPATPRDHSRMLVLGRKSGKISHRHFYDLLDYLKKGDTLVINNTRVIPSRLILDDERILLLLRKIGKEWEALAESGEFPLGERFKVKGGIQGEVISEPDTNNVLKITIKNEELLSSTGHVPLPPYIYAYHGSDERYQTVYAQVKGSAAAPTAGFHFTQELLGKVREGGISIAEVTLHVSVHTFLPILEKDILEHKIYTEYIKVSPETADILRKAKRTICVGTTSVRTLEQMWAWKRGISSCEGWADLYITPGFTFHFQGLITNFHYPRTTNLVLVSSFVGREKMERAYKVAIQDKYRLFSFGDAMLII